MSNSCNIQKIGNQQDYNLNNNQLQAILSGDLGDGHISVTKSNKGKFICNCIYKEYIEYKKDLLGEIANPNIRSVLNQGYKKRIIHSLYSKPLKIIKDLKELPLRDKLDLLDNLGLALWFYEDGSLHKTNHFFNLNTHSFTEYEHYTVLVPFFKKLGMNAEVYKDVKKDGREFFYLYFGKHHGAYEVMKILSQYPVECYKYKLWSSETIQKWSKLKVELKSKGIEVTPRKFTNILLGKATI